MAVIKKRFIEIDIPLIRDSVEVLGTPETLSGKTVKLDLTRKLRGKSMEVVFKIIKSDDGTLFGYPKKMQLMGFYIKRMIRKRISYVEDSFKADCKDMKVIVKPFLITRKRVSRSVKNNLRRTTKDFILKYLKEKDYIEVCEDIIQGDFQKLLFPKLKKIYPLSLCEIRDFEVISMPNSIIKTPERIAEKRTENIQEDFEEEKQEEVGNSEEEVEKQSEEKEKPKKTRKKSSKKIAEEEKEE